MDTYECKCHERHAAAFTALIFISHAMRAIVPVIEGRASIRLPLPAAPDGKQLLFTHLAHAT